MHISNSLRHKYMQNRTVAKYGNWKSRALTLTAVYYVAWFGLVYMFIHSVTYITLDTSLTDYSLQHNL